MTVIRIHRDEYHARVFRTARWLKGHAGRNEHVFCKNFRTAVNQHTAALRGVPPAQVQAEADQFVVDVLERMADIDQARLTNPPAKVFDLAPYFSIISREAIAKEIRAAAQTRRDRLVELVAREVAK